ADSCRQKRARSGIRGPSGSPKTPIKGCGPVKIYPAALGLDLRRLRSRAEFCDCIGRILRLPATFAKCGCHARWRVVAPDSLPGNRFKRSEERWLRGGVDLQNVKLLPHCHILYYQSQINGDAARLG